MPACDWLPGTPLRVVCPLRSVMFNLAGLGFNSRGEYTVHYIAHSTLAQILSFFTPLFMK